MDIMVLHLLYTAMSLVVLTLSKERNSFRILGTLVPPGSNAVFSGDSENAKCFGPKNLALPSSEKVLVHVGALAAKEAAAKRYPEEHAFIEVCHRQYPNYTKQVGVSQQQDCLHAQMNGKKGIAGYLPTSQPPQIDIGKPC